MAAVEKKQERWSWHSLSTQEPSQAGEFFSQHYGVWSDKGPRPGLPCKLSEGKMIQEGDTVRVCTDSKGTRVGQMIFRHCNTQQLGSVCWVKQLVVHKDYRRRGIATFLLNTLGGFRYVALVTCNHHTVRALEKMADSQLLSTSEIAAKLVDESKVDYLRGARVRAMAPASAVMTNFHVKHPEGSWLNLQPGEEFLAVVQPRGYQQRLA